MIGYIQGMKKKILIVDFPPTALKRPRFSTFNGKAFDSQKKEKEAERWDIYQQWKENPLDDPIRLTINYHVQMPGSWSKKKSALYNGSPCIKRPDLDNYVKWTLDVLNGVVFIDDSQVFEIRADKKYSDEPRTEIIVEYEKNVAKDQHG